MQWVNRMLNPAFDLLFLPVAGRDPWWGLAWIALLTAILALVVYRYSSSQDRIRKVKERLKAHLLEMRLFQHDPLLLGRAVRSVLQTNLSYLRLNVKPFLFMFVPVAVLLIQAEARFGHRALSPDEMVLVRSFWKTDSALEQATLPQRLRGQGISIDHPPLRIPEKREIDWRVRGTGAGSAALLIESGAQRVAIPLALSRGILPVSTWHGRPDSWDMLLHPAAKPLPADGELVTLQIDYPERVITFRGHSVGWIWPFFILTLIAGYLLKGLVGVQF